MAQPVEPATFEAASGGFLAGRPAFVRWCRPPRVGFAEASDLRWELLRTVAHRDHLQPADLLPGARSVVAWFLPFRTRLVEDNRGGAWATADWAAAYVQVNELLAETTAWATDWLADRGFRAAVDPPTGRFDRERLVAPWSHKHAAWVCGLGTFGRHAQLISADGPAGRCVSLVTDAAFPPSPAVVGERCLSRSGGGCELCVDACPVAALAAQPFDRRTCWEHCRANAARRPDLPASQVCGKCAAACPAR